MKSLLETAVELESEPRPAAGRLASWGPPVTSVLVNTHNHAAYIDECLESLFAQTLPPDEIIVYDDNSTDDTLARLRRYETVAEVIRGRPSRLPSHLRQAHAVQTAFQHSAGRYVFLLDGDDRFKPHKIERYAEMFARHPDAALIQAPMDKIDPQGRLLGTNCEPRKHVADLRSEIYRRQDVDFYYPTSALAFSRDYLEQVVPLDLSDRYPLWIDTRLSITAPLFGRVITLSETLTEWRRHAGSDSLQRARSRRLQIQQTLMRTRIFNEFCRRRGWPGISLWRNRRFYLQWLRWALPDAAYAVFYDYVRPRWQRLHPQATLS